MVRQSVSPRVLTKVGTASGTASGTARAVPCCFFPTSALLWRRLARGLISSPPPPPNLPGYIGVVKDATESTARVELHSTCQTISVDRQRLTTMYVLHAVAFVIDNHLSQFIFSSSLMKPTLCPYFFFFLQGSKETQWNDLQSRSHPHVRLPDSHVWHRFQNSHVWLPDSPA